MAVLWRTRYGNSMTEILASTQPAQIDKVSATEFLQSLIDR